MTTPIPLITGPLTVGDVNRIINLVNTLVEATVSEDEAADEAAIQPVSAIDVSFDPAGLSHVSAVDVQNAISELDAAISSTPVSVDFSANFMLMGV